VVNESKVLVGKPVGHTPVEELRRNGKIILKYNFS
jgi:hypothetical protein